MRQRTLRVHEVHYRALAGGDDYVAIQTTPPRENSHYRAESCRTFICAPSGPDVKISRNDAGTVLVKKGDAFRVRVREALKRGWLVEMTPETGVLA